MAKRGADESGSDQEDVEMIDVDFDFCSLKELDFHAVKLLLSQLLTRDASLVDVSGLTDYLIKQEGVGTVVKTDGEAGDPFAITSLVPLASTDVAVTSIKQYIDKCIGTSISIPDGGRSTALIVSSRLINMPPQIAFPCYRLLLEEAPSLGQTFTHALVLSKVFRASEDDLATDPNAHIEADDGMAKSGNTKQKKTKKAKREKQTESQVWAYHPEDDLFAKHAVSKVVYAFKASSSEAAEGATNEEDAFGVDSMGQLILLEWSAFEKAVSEMEAFLGSAVSPSS